MTAVIFDDSTARQHMREVGRLWWLPLLNGIIWLLLAWILLSFDATTVWTVAIFTGIYLIFGGLAELVMASVAPSWRWLYVVFGIISIGIGIACFVWPDITFLALAALISWLIMFSGVFHVIAALSTKDVDDLWWFTLIVGIAEILVGFWAIGYAGRSTVLLVVWLAAIALGRGIADIVLAFQARKLRDA